MLRLLHVLVRLLQNAISDERFEQGIDEVWSGVVLLSVRERQVGGHLHGLRGLSIIHEEGTMDTYSDGR